MKELKGLIRIALTTNTGRVALMGVATAAIAFQRGEIGTEALVAAIFGGVYAITQRWATRKAQDGPNPPPEVDIGGAPDSGPFAGRKR